MFRHSIAAFAIVCCAAAANAQLRPLLTPADYLVGVAPKERERLLREKKPVRTSFAARNLRAGTEIALVDVSAFAFSPDGRFVSSQRCPVEGKWTPNWSFTISALVRAPYSGT